MKGSGQTRSITPVSGSVSYNRSVFENEVAMPDVVASESYFSEKTGAYSLFMEGHNFSDDEKEAAKFLADEGYITVLTPENVKMYSTNKTKKGILKYTDGLISGVVYEQKTPKPESSTERAKSINNALQHARDKGARVAVIYDKYRSFHREDIDAGIRLFEATNSYRFAGIITINTVHEKKVNEWLHNK